LFLVYPPPQRLCPLMDAMAPANDFSATCRITLSNLGFEQASLFFCFTRSFFFFLTRVPALRCWDFFFSFSSPSSIDSDRTTQGPGGKWLRYNAVFSSVGGPLVRLFLTHRLFDTTDSPGRRLPLPLPRLFLPFFHSRAPVSGASPLFPSVFGEALQEVWFFRGHALPFRAVWSCFPRCGARCSRSPPRVCKADPPTPSVSPPLFLPPFNIPVCDSSSPSFLPAPKRN